MISATERVDCEPMFLTHNLYKVKQYRKAIDFKIIVCSALPGCGFSILIFDVTAVTKSGSAS